MCIYVIIYMLLYMYVIMLFVDTHESQTAPEIRLVPETPNINSSSHSFDFVDGQESEESLSPQMRPRISSNISEGKKKLALKFRKKKVDDQNNDSICEKNKEEDIDEIFKSYEEENARNLSNSMNDSSGNLNVNFKS